MNDLQKPTTRAELERQQKLIEQLLIRTSNQNVRIAQLEIYLGACLRELAHSNANSQFRDLYLGLRDQKRKDSEWWSNS